MKNLSQNAGKIVLCICEIVIGVLLFMNPVGVTGTIIKIIGGVMAVGGVLLVIRYFRTDPIEAHLGQGLAKGILALAAGLFCLFKSNWFIATFPIVTILYGVVILITGIVRVQWTVDMIRMKSGNWILSGLGALISLVFGVIVLANPFDWTGFLWTFVAISMIVDAVFDLCTVLFFGA